MKTMKDKLKRKHVQWFVVLKDRNDSKLNSLFIKHLSKVYGNRTHHTHLSTNRCAYYALKEYYHTTSIDDLREVLGL